MDRVIRLGPRGGKIVGYRHGANGIEPIYARDRAGLREPPSKDRSGATRVISMAPGAGDVRQRDLAESLTTGKEVLRIFSGEGEQLLFRRGGVSFTAFPWNEQVALRGRNATITHTHPKGASFSASDVAAALNSHAAVIEAVACVDESERPYRSVSRIYRISIDHSALTPLGAKALADYKIALTSYQDEFNATYDKWDRAAYDGKITQQQANVGHSHAIMLRMAELLGFRYEVLGDQIAVEEP